MMIIKNAFELGAIVYLRTDREQYERIITSVTITVGGNFRYQLCCGTQDTWHYESEIAVEKNVLITTTN